MSQRSRLVIAIAIVGALVSAGPVAATAAKFVLGGFNAVKSTTTIQLQGPGAVLNLEVPAGQPPIDVSAGAGKATNLDADELDGHDASEFVQGPTEAWHEVGTPGQPGWGIFSITSVGDPFAPVAFARDPLGFVHLQGRVGAGLITPAGCDAYAMFTLPTGYRPSGELSFSTVGLDINTVQEVLARVDVMANGDISLCYPHLDRYGWVSLDGITFRATP